MALNPAQVMAAQQMISKLVAGIHLQDYIQAKLADEKDEKARSVLLDELSSVIAEASRLMLSRYTFIPTMVEIATQHPSVVRTAYQRLVDGTREGTNLSEAARARLRELVEEKSGGDFAAFVIGNAAALATQAFNSDAGRLTSADVSASVTGGSSGDYDFAVMVMADAVMIGEAIVHGVQAAVGWVEGAIDTIGHWIGGLFS